MPDEHPTTGGIRSRFRSHVQDEVKQAALRQLADGGPQALSLNAIAKQLGVSGPALYRYFAGRDELLTALVVDAYHDLAVALAAASRRGRRLPPSERLRALAAAYRAWGTAQPHRYRLLFTAPLPGYDAQSQPLVTASKESMNVLLDVLADLVAQGADVRPGGLDRQLGRWADSSERPGVTPAVGRRALTAWTRLHGFVSLEIEGNYDSMGVDADLLFDAEVTALLDADMPSRPQPSAATQPGTSSGPLPGDTNHVG